MSLITTFPPAVEPITLETARQHTRSEGIDADDALLSLYIAAAREWCEDYQGISYITRSYELLVDAAASVELPHPPLQTVDAVHWIDADGVETEITSDGYTLNTKAALPVITLTDGVPAGAVSLRVRYTAGYTADDVSIVPANTRAAILLLVGDYYAYREAGTMQPQTKVTVERLLGPGRLNWGF